MFGRAVADHTMHVCMYVCNSVRLREVLCFEWVWGDLGAIAAAQQAKLQCKVSDLSVKCVFSQGVCCINAACCCWGWGEWCRYVEEYHMSDVTSELGLDQQQLVSITQPRCLATKPFATAAAPAVATSTKCQMLTWHMLHFPQQMPCDYLFHAS